MNIKHTVCKLSDLIPKVQELLISEFQFTVDTAGDQCETKLSEFIQSLKRDLFCVIEQPYVDKVYRDSFYNYYSSKLNSYNRNCIKIAFFLNQISIDNFRNDDDINGLQNSIVGFLVLRPTESNIIGRNVISPKALKSTGFEICYHSFPVTVNSIKFSVVGFPHSSQDTETIMCAETSVWAVMEYFGNRYPEYSPVLPSDIIKGLSILATQRQLPSNGLPIDHISFSLKEFGFGTYLYSREEYGGEFEVLLSCYVESGIPVVLGLDNSSYEEKTQSIYHANILIGRNVISETEIDDIEGIILGSKTVFQYSAANPDFIFIDDNFPPYQKGKLKAPCDYYPNKNWKMAHINYFVVPLYNKVYLEAFKANRFINSILSNNIIQTIENEIVIRTFLTSSRSFKNSLARNSTFIKAIKEELLDLFLPKFIWCTELSTKALIKQKKAFGLIILDSTEANFKDLKPLLYSVTESRRIKISPQNRNLTMDVVSLTPFSIYENNLKRF